MQLGSQAPIARDLAELATWTARDGAIGETMAAWLAGQALEGSADPAVRAVLERIVRDETEHAELAWATLRWALAQGGAPVQAAIEAVFASLGAPRGRAEPWQARLAACGVPDPVQEIADAAACISAVIRPVSIALLRATPSA
jgi:hypothetical protein